MCSREGLALADKAGASPAACPKKPAVDRVPHGDFEQRDFPAYTYKSRAEAARAFSACEAEL